MKKILFLTSRIPFPPIGGDKLRTYNILKYLSQENSLTLFSFIEKKDPKIDKTLLEMISDMSPKALLAIDFFIDNDFFG